MPYIRGHLAGGAFLEDRWLMPLVRPGGACRWPVFIYGKGLRAGVAFLVKGDQALPALKTWVLNPTLAYAVFNLRTATA